MHIKFSSIDQIFAALNVDRHNPLEVLRVMMIHAFLINEEQKKNGGVSDQYIIRILEDEEFNQSLASYGIRPLEKNEFHGHLDALKELSEQIRNTHDFFQYFNYLYPYLIKDKGAFGRYANTPLVLYVLLYCLIEDSDRCPPDNRTDGEYIDVHYFSRVETLCKGF